MIGTKPEHFNAVWVKNEWSRFLSMMKKDRSKLLLPCYRDMDPYDLPEALSVLQSYDMGKIGFMQDLIRGVKKVIDAGKPQETAKETVKETVVVHNEGGSNVQALLKRGNMALEDGEWGKADEFFEQVLNQDAECGAAYLGKFLARVECRSAKAYADAIVEEVKDDAPDEKNADACEPDEAFIASCVEKYIVPRILSEDDIRRMLSFDLGYCLTSDYYERAVEDSGTQLAADKDLMRAVKYASNEAKTILDNIQKELDKLHADAQKREDAEKARITAEYRKFLTETEAKLEKEHPQRLKEAEEARKAEIYRQRKAKAAAKKTGIIAGVAAAVIALVLVITKVIVPASRYSKAEQLRDEGNYDAAIAGFAVLGYYKDAPAQLAQTRALKEEAEEEARNARAYANAEELLENGDYNGAIAAFKKLGDYQDAASRAKNAEAQKQETENAQAYANAETLLNAGEYDSAAEAFDMLGDYTDAAARVLECHYIAADQLQAQGKNAEAAFAFAKIAEYEDAQERSFALWDTIAERETLALGTCHTVALKADGTVVAVGRNENGQCNVSNWDDIVAVSAGGDRTIGLRADGTVMAVGYNNHGQCNVSDWTNVVAIHAESWHTVGLRADGTVVAVGDNDNGQCDVSDWTDIVAISASYLHTVGLKSNGTVVAVGKNDYGQCDVSDWTDIVAISVGNSRTAGLKSDGTVVVAGYNKNELWDVSDWTDIVAISAGNAYIVGLKSDGTVVAVGYKADAQYDVSGWTDIVAISVEGYHRFGLKANGTMVAVDTGKHCWDGECNVSDWTDIVAIYTGSNRTVGLKSDGTVIAVGNNYYGQCDVSGWMGIKPTYTH